LDWQITNILAVPSIITSQWTELETIILEKKLAFDWYANLPLNYAWSQYKVLWEAGSLNLVNSEELVVFSWKTSELSADDAEWKAARKAMVEKLKAAYSSTKIANREWIRKLVNVDITDDSMIETVAVAVVNNKINSWMITASKLSVDVPESNTVVDSACTETTSLTLVTDSLVEIANMAESINGWPLDWLYNIYRLIADNSEFWTYWHYGNIEASGIDWWYKWDAWVWKVFKIWNLITFGQAVSSLPTNMFDIDISEDWLTWTSLYQNTNNDLSELYTHEINWESRYFRLIMRGKSHNNYAYLFAWDNIRTWDLSIHEKTTTVCPVDWTCWSANWWDFTTEPTNLCSVWTATVVTDWWAGNSYTWSCQWSGWWSDVSCSGNHIIPPVAIVDQTTRTDLSLSSAIQNEQAGITFISDESVLNNVNNGSLPPLLDWNILNYAYYIHPTYWDQKIVFTVDKPFKIWAMWATRQWSIEPFDDKFTITNLDTNWDYSHVQVWERDRSAEWFELTNKVLPAWKYEFFLNGIRQDSEWYVEAFSEATANPKVK